MRTYLLSLMLLAASEGRAASSLAFIPESLTEGCAKSWQVTESESVTQLSFSELSLIASPTAAAQVKQCRIAWKPLIPPGCYAPSARLRIRGSFDPGSESAPAVKAQLRFSHDLFGQGDMSVFQSRDLEAGPFELNVELPEERFQSSWNEVKLVTHLSLILRRKKQETDPVKPSTLEVPGQLSIQSLELESLRGRDCNPVEPRKLP